MKVLITLLVILTSFSQDFDHVLISYNKRIKPLQTFYNEGMRIVYGKENTKLDGVKRNASETVQYMFEKSHSFRHEKIFVVDHREFKMKVGLNADQKYFNYDELVDNQLINDMIRQAIDKSRNKVVINVIEDAALQVNSQIRSFSDMFNIVSYQVVPTEGEWITLYDAVQGGVQFATASGYSAILQQVSAYQKSKIDEDLASKRDYELTYNNLHPFLYAWILLLISTILMGIFQLNESSTYKKIAGVSFTISFLFIVVGFVLRVLISGRAPVTNMYESVIWVGFAACTLVAAKFLSKKDNQTKLIPYALGAATLSIMAADLLPAVFDSSIAPLQPVLRSTFWLTTHVLVITFSYGAFAVSFVISLVATIKYLLNKKYSPQIEKANYSALKVGTLTLALGTLLGAIWADFAWGRFWGWDPKETWAAITLLVYMIILHGRFAGWVKKELNYVYSIFGFVSVLMAWYGVNYILGVGLHSYGFSKSGNSWFFYLSAALTILNVIAITKFQKSEKKKAELKHIKNAHA